MNIYLHALVFLGTMLVTAILWSYRRRNPTESKDGHYVFRYSPLLKVFLLFGTVELPLLFIDGTIVMPDVFSKVVFLSIYAMGLYAAVAVFHNKIILQSDQLIASRLLLRKVIIKLSEIKRIYYSKVYSSDTVEDVHGRKIRIDNLTMGADFLLEEIKRRRYQPTRQP